MPGLSVRPAEASVCQHRAVDAGGNSIKVLRRVAARAKDMQSWQQYDGVGWGAAHTSDLAGHPDAASRLCATSCLVVRRR
eukprot:2201780-Rhodomonas_salina.1